MVVRLHASPDRSWQEAKAWMIMVVVCAVACLHVLTPRQIWHYNQVIVGDGKILYLDSNLIACYEYSYVYYIYALPITRRFET